MEGSAADTAVVTPLAAASWKVPQEAVVAFESLPQAGMRLAHVCADGDRDIETQR